MPTIDSKIQNFLWSLDLSLFTVFGYAFSSLPPDVYEESACFLNTLSKCHFLPRMKLKLIVKHFLKAFVQNSPTEQQSMHRTIDPLLTSFLPWLHKHIDERWDVTRNQESLSPEDERLAEELISDEANRLLSREFADLLNCLLLTSPKRPVPSEDQADGLMDVDMAAVVEKDLSLSPAWPHVIRSHLSTVVSMVVGALTWPDSQVNLRAALTNRLVLKEMLEKRLISTVDDVSFLVHHILFSMRLFEENDSNQTALLQLTLVVYEGLAKSYSEDMRAPFWQLSQTPVSEWHKFHQTLIEPSISGKAVVTDKKKKEALKSLLATIFAVSYALSASALLLDSLSFPSFTADRLAHVS